jgi:hydroxypyruvate reductase
MAAVVEAHWRGPLEGLVITRYGHAVPCHSIKVVEAAHPVPDEAGLAAARQLLPLVHNLTDDDLVLCLISGGGSALMTIPASGITLQDKQTITRELLRSGATIAEINCVRKHLSAIKGGRLAAAAFPARVVTLMVSDVPGDDAAVIASGPTVADLTTSSDAVAVLQRYQIGMSPGVAAWLQSPASESIKPGDARLRHTGNQIIATAGTALVAASKVAEAAGFRTAMLGDALEGEARELGREHAQLALRCRQDGASLRAPCVLVSGGETTVTVRGQGRGGRNAEYLLALACELKGAAGIHAMACDTDGIDGTEDNAGAVIGPDVLARARALGLDAETALAGNDAYGFFAMLDCLVVTGPTRTNVNDFRALLIE